MSTSQVLVLDIPSNNADTIQARVNELARSGWDLVTAYQLPAKKVVENGKQIVINPTRIYLRRPQG